MRRGWVIVSLAVIALIGGSAVVVIVRDAGDEDIRAEFPPPAECEPDARDLNASNSAVEPSRGKALIERGGDAVPLGFNDNSYVDGWLEPEQAFTLYRLAGATLTRLPLDWGAVEGSPGELDFIRYDDVYCAALAAGVRPVWHVTGIPAWAAPFGACTAPCLRPPDDEHLSQLERFAEIAAARYPRSAGFEAWNEPNLRAFWGEDPDPEAYAALQEAIYTGVKNGNPNMPVLGGALSNNPADDSGGVGLSFGTYLNALIGFGALDYMDGLSIHAYPLQPLGAAGDQFTPTLAAAREALAAAGGGVRIWVTEVGAPTAATSFAPAVSAESQAAILTDVVRAADAAEDVDAVFFHTLLDTPEGQPQESGFGFFSPPDSAGSVALKPAVCAVRELAGEHGECPASVVF